MENNAISATRAGRTIEEAAEKALEALNAERIAAETAPLTREEIRVTVLDEGAKGFLGIGSRPAKVSVQAKETDEDRLRRFLTEVTNAIGLNVQIDITQKEKTFSVNMTGENMGVLIGKRGQTLDSLQYLTNLVMNRCSAPEFSVTLDTENYRRRRRETLEALALQLARKVKTTKKTVVLEPMSRFERHVIHTILQRDQGIKTYSDGVEPYRYVAIAPK